MDFQPTDAQRLLVTTAREWLRRRCPGYRASCILKNAGHNVLLRQPDVCAEQVLSWVTDTRGSE